MNIHFHPNGKYASKFITPLIEKERELGAQVSLVVSCNKENENDIQIPYDLSIKNLALIPLSFIRIIKLLIKHRPKYVISHNSRSSLIPLLASRIAGIKHIVYFNHGAPFLGYEGPIRIALKLLEKINILLAKNTVTVSSDIQNELKKITSKQVDIILNGSCSGIDLKYFSGQKKIDYKFKKSLGVNEDDFLAVYVGRPEERKGFHFILELWKNYFSDKNSECFKLLVCGCILSDAAKVLPSPQKNIHFLGFRNDINKILFHSDTLILPSKHEGLSYSILEALATKTPVIANDIPGIRNIIKNNNNGYLLKINDHEGYANRIRVIKNDSKNGKLDIILKNGIETTKKYERNNFLNAYIAYLKLVR